MNVFTVTPFQINACRPGVEDIHLNVQYRKFPSIIIGCLCRHPKSSVQTFEYIGEILNLTSLTSKTFYVSGYFNDDLLSVNSNLKKILAKPKLSQVIDKPTRVTSLSAALLNIVITNKCKTILHSDVVPCPIADHDLITATVNIRKPKRKPAMTKTTRQLANYSPLYLCNLLGNESNNLIQIFNTDDVNNEVRIFTDIFYRCLNDCAPMVSKVRRRPFASCFNDAIRTAIGER